MKLERMHIYYNFIQFLALILFFIELARIPINIELPLISILGLNILIGLITLPYYLAKKFRFPYILLSLLNVEFLFQYGFYILFGIQIASGQSAPHYMIAGIFVLVTLMLNLYLFFKMKK